MQHNTIVDLPIIALFLFIAIFLLVVARIWLKGKNDPTHAHMAQLPLSDGDDAPFETTPTDEDGGRHV